MGKFQAIGVGAIYLRLLDSYSQPRLDQVIIEGVALEPCEISNSVFQRTLLGPPLWNMHFADVTQPAESTGGEAEKIKCFEKIFYIGIQFRYVIQCVELGCAHGARSIEFLLTPAKKRS